MRTGSDAKELTIEAVRKFTSKWGAMLAVVGAGFGTVYDQRATNKELRESFQRLQTQVSEYQRRNDAIHSFSADGFLDPAVRLALEATLRTFLRAYTTEHQREVNTWTKTFFDINPTLRKPSE